MYDFTHTLALGLQSGRESGFTISTVTGDSRTHGFAVGGDPECPEIRVSKFAEISPGLLRMHLDNYVTAARLFGQGTVGGWVHEGDLYLDAPTIFLDQEDAEEAARERGEKAYFDLDTLTEHFVN